MMMKEIPGYPLQYATTDGLIFSMRNGELKQKSMRLHNGYFRVNLRDGKLPVKLHAEPVHKIILETFVGKRPEGLVCRHLNGNPLDNRLENICWGTQQENAQDAIRHGTAVCLRRGEEHVAAKLSNDDVKNIRRLYKEGYLQRELGDLYGVTQRHISDIVNWQTRLQG